MNLGEHLLVLMNYIIYHYQIDYIHYKNHSIGEYLQDVIVQVIIIVYQIHGNLGNN